MISVKGAKTNNSDALPGEEFAEREPLRRSRLPYVVGAVLSAIVLYVKSAMPSAAETVAPAPHHPGGSSSGKERLDETQDRLAADGGPDNQAQDTVRRTLNVPEEESASLIDVSSGGTTVHFGPSLATLQQRAANTNNLPMVLSQEVAVLEGLDLVSQEGGSVGGGDTSSRGGGASGPSRPVKRDAPPAAARQPYLLEVTSGAITAIALTDLLASVEQAGASTLSLVDASVTSGTLIPTGNGFLYQSATEFVGQVELSYKVTDGTSTTTHVAKLTIDPKVVEGTGVGETLTGSDYVEDLRGLGGDDDIDGGKGADILHGGAGNDRLSGGAGDDRIYGEDGNDTIFGGAGNDWVSGGAGDDNVNGQDGNDVLAGDAGNDVLSDGSGADTVLGGEGNDVVRADADGQSDELDGGAGTDTLDYSAASTAMVIDLIQGVAQGAGIGTDEVVGFEIIIAGSGDDQIIAGRGELTMSGGEGNDRFEFIGTEPNDQVIRTIHQILDFDVGDRIIARGIELFERSDDDTSELSELTEHDPTSGGVTPIIRLTYDKFEDYDQTVIEWDSDGVDDLTTVLLHGHHVLVWSSTT